MNEVLFNYEKVAPTSWVYLASLLSIGLYFKFGRLWSVRNLDLILLILLGPGLLFVHFGQEAQRDAQVEFAAEGIDIRDVELNDGRSANGLAESRERSGDSTDPNAPAENSTTNSTLPADPTLGNPDPARTEGSRIDQLQKQWDDGRAEERSGYIWLFVVGGLLMIRLLLDPTMVRRPLLEPNLSTGGLTFLGIFLFLHLMTNVIKSKPSADDLRGPMGAAELVSGKTSTDEYDFERHGPGYALLFLLPSLPTVSLDANVDRNRNEEGSLNRPWHYRNQFGDVVQVEGEYVGANRAGEVFLRKSDGEQLVLEYGSLNPEDQKLVSRLRGYVALAKFMALFSNLAVVLGIVGIGYWHFNNFKIGIGVATLYLLIPYTSQMTGRVDHVMPAALLVWAVLCYRRPITAGIFVGLATGVVYYPLFLLPLWISFYWQRGLMRFVVSVVVVLGLMLIPLILSSGDFSIFWHKVRAMFGLMAPQQEGLLGIWRLGWHPIYRLSFLAGFGALSGSMALWPPQKNLGTLLSCSAAIMLATQFWHGYGGGVYLAWYLPLLLLTVFRPNLEDRVALSVLDESWVKRRRKFSVGSLAA